MTVYSYPGLQGLEIWHGLTRYSSLEQLRHDKRAYFAGLSEFLAALHRGEARTDPAGDLSHAAAFSRLLLAGGDAAEASALLEWPHELAAPGPFAARAGAEAIWREMGWRNPVAIDLGQTRLKCMTRTSETWYERDVDRLPYGRNALPFGQGGDALRAFLAESLPDSFDGCVLGLPAAIDSSGVAEPSTYPGLAGPLDPLFETLFAGRPWVAVNDAVLTARGYPPAAGEKMLVLTLGFGVGAALWH